MTRLTIANLGVSGLDLTLINGCEVFLLGFFLEPCINSLRLVQKTAVRIVLEDMTQRREFVICMRCWMVVAIDGQNNTDREPVICSHLGPFTQATEIQRENDHP